MEIEKESHKRRRVSSNSEEESRPDSKERKTTHSFIDNPMPSTSNNMPLPFCDPSLLPLPNSDLDITNDLENSGSSCEEIGENYQESAIYILESIILNVHKLLTDHNIRYLYQSF